MVSRFEGTSAHRGRLEVEKRTEKMGRMGMNTKSRKSCKAKLVHQAMASLVSPLPHLTTTATTKGLSCPQA